jgi:pyridoxamine 5'-phosphate oxidase
VRAWSDAWLSEDPLPADPFPIAMRWLEEAFAAGAQPNPHGIALATVDEAGRPDVRLVLCKALEPATGSLVFYTHKPSAKGSALRARPDAAAVFYFGPQERQVRIAGPVSEVSDAEADAYFATRPLDSRVGAWASAQSEPIASRAALEAEFARRAAEFGARLDDPRADAAVPRPPHWGGYRIHAERVELWHGRPGRLHDRALWTRALPAGAWTVARLQP